MWSRKLKILNVDDDLVESKMFARQLSKTQLGVDLVTAHNSKQFWKELEQNQFDCVFLDYRLNDTDGVELTKDLKAKGYSFPVVIITNQASPDLYQKALNAGATNYITKDLLTPDGLALIINTSIERFRIEQELETAKRKAEELANVKQQFLANMSHEIRTPMNAIIGFSRILTQKSLDKESARLVQSIYTASENLLHLINDILDFTKLEEGQVNLENITFDASSVCQGAFDLLESYAEQKKINFVLDIQPNIFSIVKGDPHRLNQILVNLLNNAIKFTDEGGVVKLKLRYLENDKSFQFTVKDNGIGIPEDKVGQLFESFTQADADTTRKYGGTGLGLSIVKTLTELMKGSVRVQSELGFGSEFIIEIPFELSEEIVNTNEAQSTEVSESLEGSKVLLVDDNVFNRELAEIYLEKFNCFFDMASNGKEAIDMALSQDYDIVLMDIQMPEVDGLTATKEILKKKSGQTIIGMSAHVMQEEVERSLNAGMVDYLNKPYTEKELLDVCLKHKKVGEIVNSNSKAVVNSEENNNVLEDVGFDLTFLRENFGDNTAIHKKLLSTFLLTANEYLEAMDQSLETKDWDTIERMSHKVAPGCEIIGLSELYTLIKYNEEKAKLKENWLKVEENVIKTQLELKETYKRIQTFLKEA